MAMAKGLTMARGLTIIIVAMAKGLTVAMAKGLAIVVNGCVCGKEDKHPPRNTHVIFCKQVKKWI